MLTVSEREGTELFFFKSDGQGHAVATDAAGVTRRGGFGDLVPEHWAAMLWRVASRDLEIAALVERHRMRDLAVRAIEFGLSALL